MNLTSLSDVRRTLQSLGVSPNRTLGQNFLIDRNILGILLDAAELSAQDQVLEVGPGLGVITEQLLGQVKRVVAVEKDARLARFLADRYGEDPTLCLIHADALDLDLAALLASGINKVVSNLPYSSGTRILVELATARAAPAVMVVSLQEEVARRLVASPGGKEFGALTVWLAVDYEIQPVKIVSPTCFWPRPEVSTVIVKMVKRASSRAAAEDKRFLYDLTRNVFLHRRKQLASILGRAPDVIGLSADDAAAALQALGIDRKARPEELTVDQWCALARSIRMMKETPSIIEASRPVIINVP